MRTVLCLKWHAMYLLSILSIRVNDLHGVIIYIWLALYKDWYILTPPYSKNIWKHSTSTIFVIKGMKNFNKISLKMNIHISTYSLYIQFEKNEVVFAQFKDLFCQEHFSASFCLCLSKRQHATICFCVLLLLHPRIVTWLLFWWVIMYAIRKVYCTFLEFTIFFWRSNNLPKVNTLSIFYIIHFNIFR